MAILDSRALCHGWALAFRIRGGCADEKGPAQKQENTPSPQLGPFAPHVARLLRPYADMCGGLGSVGESKNDGASSAFDASYASRPIMLLRSSPSSSVVFAVHPAAAEYAKLLVDLSTMGEMGGASDYSCDYGEDGDDEEEGPVEDGSSVSPSRLEPFPIATLMAAVPQDASGPTSPQKAEKGGAIDSNFPSSFVCGNVAMDGNVKETNASDWFRFYAAHAEDEAKRPLHTQVPPPSPLSEDSSSAEKKKKEEGAPQLSAALLPSTSAAEAFQRRLFEFVTGKTGESETSKDVGGESGEDNKPSAVAVVVRTHRPRPIVVDCLGVDNAVLAIVAAFAHTTAVAHHSLGLRGLLVAPGPALGFGGENGDGAVASAEGDAPPPTAASASEVADAIAAATLQRRQRLAFTPPVKPPASLEMDSLLGAALCFDAAMSTTSRSLTKPATDATTTKDAAAAAVSNAEALAWAATPDNILLPSAEAPLAMPYSPYEAVAARQHLLPFMADYRRPCGSADAPLAWMWHGAPIDIFRKICAVAVSQEDANSGNAHKKGKVAEGAPLAAETAATLTSAEASAIAARFGFGVEFSFRTAASMIAAARAAYEPPMTLMDAEADGFNAEALAPLLSQCGGDVDGGEDEKDEDEKKGEDTASRGTPTDAAAAEEAKQRSLFGPLCGDAGAGLCPPSALTNPQAARRTLEAAAAAERAALLAAIGRACAVMRAADYLQFQPLVELCGLSIAMSLRGRSVPECGELLAEAPRYFCAV